MAIGNRELLERDGLIGIDPKEVFGDGYSDQEPLAKRPRAFQTYAMVGSTLKGTILDNWTTTGNNLTTRGGFENFENIIKEPEVGEIIGRVRYGVVLLQYIADIDRRLQDPAVPPIEKEPLNIAKEWAYKILLTIDDPTFENLLALANGVNSRAAEVLEWHKSEIADSGYLAEEEVFVQVEAAAEAPVQNQRTDQSSEFGRFFWSIVNILVRRFIGSPTTLK